MSRRLYLTPPHNLRGEDGPGRATYSGGVMSMLRRAKRLILLATAASVVIRVLRSIARSDRVSSGAVPGIGGDTWPPVPVKPAGRG